VNKENIAQKEKKNNNSNNNNKKKEEKLTDKKHTELNIALNSEHNIRTLEIAVSHEILMQKSKSREDLSHNVHNRLLLEVVGGDDLGMSNNNTG
jgi:hypothetical protein